MKNSLPILIIISIYLTGCDQPSFSDRQSSSDKDFLFGKCYLLDVLNEGRNVAADWQNFRIQFDGTKVYNTLNSNNLTVWPASGTYELAGESDNGFDIVIRNDGLSIDIIYSNINELELVFNEPTTGLWVFTLNRDI